MPMAKPRFPRPLSWQTFEVKTYLVSFKRSLEVGMFEYDLKECRYDCSLVLGNDSKKQFLVRIHSLLYLFAVSAYLGTTR